MEQTLVRTRRLNPTAVSSPFWGWWSGSTRCPLTASPKGLACGSLWIPAAEIQRAAVHSPGEVWFLPGMPVVLRIHTAGGVHDFILRQTILDRMSLPFRPAKERSSVLPSHTRAIIVSVALLAAIIALVWQIVASKHP